MNEGITLCGHVLLQAHDHSGRLIAQRENHNLWVFDGKVLIANALAGTSGYSAGLTYCGLGTNATAPTTVDTSLGTEVTRKAITARSVFVSITTCLTFFTAAESTYHVKEVGLFGHSSATATINTGKLFARSLLDYDNAAGLYDLTVQWTLMIGPATVYHY